MPYFFFQKLWKMSQNLSSAAVVIVALRVNYNTYKVKWTASLTPLLWDKGKQCKIRSDDAECGILSGYELFA